MKSAKWEATTGALAALLATRSFAMADLYTFTLAGGRGALTYTTADGDIGYSGLVWDHVGPLFDQDGTRATAHWKLGLDTDTWQIVVAPRPIDPVTGAAYPDKIGDQPWLAAAQAGALDGAVLTVDRAYFPTWPTFPRSMVLTPTGVVTIFVGRIGAIDIGRSAAVLQCNSHLELLDQQMPINLYGAPCRHLLFDAGCQLVAASYAMTDSIDSVVSRSQFLSSIGAPGGSGTFTFGHIQFTSGANAGFSRSIKLWTPPQGAIDGIFTLLQPLSFAPAAGDAFTVWPGCDRQLSTCTAFGNQTRFGGQPFIPAPETAT